MKITALSKPTLFLFLGLALTSAHAFASEVTISSGVERFNLEEFDEDGSSLLTESGQRLLIEMQFHNFNEHSEGVLYSFSLKGYTGSVGYDGATWGGTPVIAETNYSGVGAEMLGGFRTELSKGLPSLNMLGGFGWESWSRDLRSTPVGQGYIEDYNMTYTKLGLGLWGRITPTTNAYLTISAKYPLGVDERIDEFDVDLKPQGEVSAFAELGVSHRLKGGSRFGVSLFAMEYKFKESPVANATINGLDTQVLQPKTTLKQAGLKASYSF